MNNSQIQIGGATSKSRWNLFIKNVSCDAYFQTWEWGDIEGRANRLIGRYEVWQKREVVGIFALYKYSLKRGTYIHIRQGPLFLKEAQQKTLQKVIQFIKQVAYNNKCTFIRISPFTNNPSESFWIQNKFRSAPIHNMDAELTYIVHLSDTKNVLKNMRKTTRYLIKKGIKEKNLKIVSGASQKQVNDFYSLYSSVMNAKGITVHKNIKEEFNVFKKDGNAIVFLAFNNNKIAGGMFLTLFGDSVFYRYAAHVDTSNSLPVSYLLVWKGIEYAFLKKCSYFNLWGGVAPTSDTSHPWYGLSAFKQGFGGVLETHFHAMDLPVSRFYYKTFIIEKTISILRGYTPVLGIRFPRSFRKLFDV
jgi:lipid II:glycine glycyltransferase (peptidoglycan interpeptide bridge formation enzyme)